VRFRSFAMGCEAVRALAQSGLQPANCRLVDAAEAAFTGAGDGTHALLVLGFESVDAPVVQRAARALEICRDWNGEPKESPRDAGSWRDAFLQAPYLRDNLIAAGVLVDTFETAITWDRFEEFVAEVRERGAAAVAAECGSGRVTCRLTHVYPDGAAPYFTVLAPARRGCEVEQWDAVKAAVSDVLIAAGGTITHHHAVGRDHRPWYDRQRPDAFAEALRAAKRAVDPAGILNPGVLIDP
jgi:alkyldihydroxyacetonephosphate synthase